MFILNKSAVRKNRSVGENYNNIIHFTTTYHIVASRQDIERLRESRRQKEPRERSFKTKNVPDEFKGEILLNLLGEKAENILVYVKDEEISDYNKFKSLVLREFEPTPLIYLQNFQKAKRMPNETHVQLASRLLTNWDQYYSSNDEFGKITLSSAFGENVEAKLIKTAIALDNNSLNHPMDCLVAITDKLNADALIPPALCESLCSINDKNNKKENEIFAESAGSSITFSND
ncbi:transposon Ty3-I Gag-Pol polyprotein [Trichonephila clavipes]|nr:transposon Ty3-I Gag-Pol polyprotein [Trichonephila clavipes]